MKKILFMGTPAIGASVLNTLLNMKEAEVIGVVCQPDRKFNRKKEVIFSEVKELALKNNIKVYQPEKIGEIYEELKELEIDAIITCAFGQFVPDKILALPKYDSFNLHASLLPKLRGGAPIHWAIINNEKETGVSLMKMIKKMDAGDFIKQSVVEISETETYESLYYKLSVSASNLLKENFDLLFDNNLTWTKQIEEEATFGYNIKKEDAILDFSINSNDIERKIRGLNNKPFAVWLFNDLSIKVLESKISKIKSTNKPGTINKVNKEGIFINTNDYDLIITKIQLPSKKALEIKQIINANNHPFKEFIIEKI